MGKKTGFTDVQKKAIFARDGYSCVPHQGDTLECSGDVVAHHRVNRGLGGSKAANRVENGLTVCSSWNYLVESDAQMASVARFYGWKLRSFEKPEVEPVYYPADDAWFLLNDKGGKSPDSPNSKVIEDVPF